MIGDGFGRDSGTPKRRMLPAVTDVVRELARTASADPAVLFKAARSVVADELGRVKQGFESAPLDVLVKRARRQLEQEGVVAAAPETSGESRSIEIPAPPIRARDRTPHPPSADEPFASAHAADLEWEKDLHIQADDAPFRSAILPLPPRARAPQEIADPSKTGAPPPQAPAPPAKLPMPDRVLAPEGLAVDRSGSAARPKPVDDLPLFSAPDAPEPPAAAPEPPREPEPPAFEMAAFTLPEPAPPAPREEPPSPSWDEPPAPRVEAPPPSWDEPPAPRFETPPPPSRVEPPTPRFDPSRPSRVEPPAPRTPEPPRFETPPPVYPPARIEPPIRSMSEMPPLASVVGDVTEPVVEPEMGEFAFKGKEEPPPPAKSSSKAGWLIAIAVVLAVGAGLFWLVRTFTSGSVVSVETPPAPKKRETPPPAPAPATSAPAPAPAPAKPAPAAAKPAAAAAPVPKGKAAPLVTPDWSGKPAVYVVHFTSHKDRPSADKEAKRLAAELGKPGRAVEVDLGEKGVWYRVVLGEFASPEDARAWRADLEAKKTPNLGFVYEMRGR